MDLNELFSADFATARRRFRDAALAAGASLQELLLEARGPHDEPLGIDIAWLGTSNAQRVLLHTSGLHGVEGFAGSAIQLHLLSQPPALPSDMAVVLLHVVNPYGMAWLRRFNENNVDLNRNFLAPGEAFSGAPDAYRTLNSLLNPTGPARGVDLFYVHAGWRVLRHGFHNLKQAIAQGQYDYPHGLFYGGAKLEPSAVAVLAWCREHLKGAERVFVIDIHTGLGPSGVDSLLTHYASESEPAQQLRKHLGDKVQCWDRRSVAYHIRGGFLEALERELAPAAVTTLCQEYGTYSPLSVLAALRQENRLHHAGQSRQLNHPAKQRLVEAFCPRSPVWRTQILERGATLFDAARQHLL